MKIRIGCTDGNTYETADIPESELQDWLDENEGRIGTGTLRDLVCNTVDEFLDWYKSMLSNSDPDFDTTDVTLVIDGYHRTFDYDKIVWHEIVRD